MISRFIRFSVVPRWGDTQRYEEASTPLLQPAGKAVLYCELLRWRSFYCAGARSCVGRPAPTALALVLVWVGQRLLRWRSFLCGSASAYCAGAPGKHRPVIVLQLFPAAQSTALAHGNAHF